MARGVNKVILVGNLGKDPETRYMPNGKAVTNFSHRHFRELEGQADRASSASRPSGTTSSCTTAWPRSPREYLRKGSQVYIEGKLRTRKWQDKEGRDRYTTEINANEMQMLGSRAGGGRWRCAWAAVAVAANRARHPRRQRQRACQRRGRFRRRHPVLRRPRPGESMPRVYLKTFGCQMNEYDSARMADVLRAAGGYEPTDNPEEADLLLLNTCSVREKAQEKVFSQLGRWRELKAARPHVIIGVGGCVASQEGAGITDRAPFVDLVFGPQTIHRLPDMLGAAAQPTAGPSST